LNFFTKFFLVLVQFSFNPIYDDQKKSLPSLRRKRDFVGAVFEKNILVCGYSVDVTHLWLIYFLDEDVYNV
jgi:hypothetical protein